MTNVKDKKYRLGLDLGTNSIGWAAVSLDDNDEPCGVLGMGVRIFPDGRDAQSKTSNAVDRRMARGQRRRRDRYLERRRDLMDALVEFGLMPQDAEQRKDLQTLDPYALRAKALDEPLEPSELARALFHLNQRRGFKSNRKADTDEVEGRSLSERIGELRRQMQETSARTLGEFLYRRRVNSETVRARPDLRLYPDRAMYLEEFCKIRAAQKPHQPLTPDQWDKLKEIIFHQRPLEPVDPGWCQFEYENDEKRAAKALPVFQEFRILQEVNNIRVRVGSQPERRLDERERGAVLARLRSGKDIDFGKLTGDLRKLLAEADFNLALGGREKIKGDETTARLASSPQPAKGDKPAKPGLFGDKWLNLPIDRRNEIVKFLLNTEDPDKVREKAIQEWGLNTAQADAVARVSLVAGYGSLSEKAINKLLPHLEGGMRYDEAVKKEYKHHSDFRNEEAHDSLPYYGKVLPRDAVGANSKKAPEIDGEVARYGRFPNPTVHIGLNQLRRVVNRLIEAHGKPQDVVVELTRDLKLNPQQKRDLLKQQREGGQSNIRFTEMLQSMGQDVTPNVLRKLRLWEEQGPPQARVCPYTGRRLSCEMVVSEQTEVDHILPYSRTLDNSPSNMVVCIAAANRFKGDRSPDEAFSSNPQNYSYQEILDRVAKFPDNKKWRFQPDAMKRFEEDDRFLDRQLNETSYLSRTAKNYLAYLYDEKGEGRTRVRAAPGRMTALLRRGWCLEGMLRTSPEGEITRKQRDDHRHHAVDAFVVACTTQGLLQKFARAAGASHNSEERLAALAGETPPWEGFDRNKLKPFLGKIVVSYKPDHGTRGAKTKSTTGQLHKETAYGLVEFSENGPSKVVTRKKLDAVKKRKDLESVRDSVMRDALLKLWDDVAREGGEVGSFSDRAAKEGVLLEKGRRQTVRRVRVLDKQTVIPIKRGKGHPEVGKPYKGYLLGGNAWADMWQMPDKQKTWKMVVVPTFHANQPGFKLEQFRPHADAKKLFRIQIDDMGALGDGAERRIVRVRKITNATSGAFVVLDEHNQANVADRVGKDMKENRYSARQLKQLGFRKVGVDEIGRVLDPGPRNP